MSAWAWREAVTRTRGKEIGRRDDIASGLQHAAADLVEFQALEQRLEIAFAEAIIALALDEFEEDRAQHVLREDLQQQALALGRGAVDQDAALAHFLDRLAMAGQALVDQVEIGVDGVLQTDTVGGQLVDGLVEVRAAQGDVLDAFAIIGLQEFLDLVELAVIALRFVQRDADLAARAGHRLREQAGDLALDVEIADLAEIEELLVELGPMRHPALEHIVGQVVEIGQAGRGLGDAVLPVGMEDEIDVIDGLVAIAVDQIEARAADAFDGGNGQLHRAGFLEDRLGAERLDRKS